MHAAFGGIRASLVPQHPEVGQSGALVAVVGVGHEPDVADDGGGVGDAELLHGDVRAGDVVGVGQLARGQDGPGGAVGGAQHAEGAGAAGEEEAIWEKTNLWRLRTQDLEMNSDFFKKRN